MSLDSAGVTNSTAPDRTAETVMLKFSGVFATLGNLLVLVTFCVCKSLKRTQNAFSINMAVSDLQAGIFQLFVPRAPAENFAGCEFLVCYPNVVLLVSALSVLCAALDRFVALKYALRYYMIVTKGKVLLTIGLIWVISAVIGFAPLYKLPRDMNNTLAFCSGKVVISPASMGIMAVGVLLPVAVTLCCVYLYIYRIARRHEDHQPGQGIALSALQLPHKSTRVSKSVRVFLFICLTMVVFWFPQALIFIFYRPLSELLKSKPFTITSCLAVLSHATNPWIYTLRNAEFWEATKKLFQTSYGKIRDCRRTSSIRVAPKQNFSSGTRIVSVKPQHSGQESDTSKSSAG